MATGLQYRQFVSLFLFLLFFCGVSFTVKRPVGLEIKCGEVKVRIIVKRQFFEQRNIPFKPEYLRLGANSTQQQSCRPKGLSESEMVISAGLQDCGTESRVHDEWLVYSNQLVMFPALVPTSKSSLILRGSSTVVPVHCHYRRKQTVHGEPLTPTWLPMTSTVGVFGLLHFSLRTMADGCASLRSSSVYQQGEAVFLEASVEAPLHPPLTLYVDHCVATLRPDPLSLPSYKFITKHGCLMDSVMPGSSSKFLPRKQDNRLCFSVQAFHFTQESAEQMFVSCHLRATLTENSYSHLNKACYFHRPTFRLAKFIPWETLMVFYPDGPGFAGCGSAYFTGVPQRETLPCVSAVTLMTASDRLERRTVTMLDVHLNQAQPSKVMDVKTNA